MMTATTTATILMVAKAIPYSARSWAVCSRSNLDRRFSIPPPLLPRLGRTGRVEPIQIDSRADGSALPCGTPYAPQTRVDVTATSVPTRALRKVDVSTASSLQRSPISLFSCILARVRVVWKEFWGAVQAVARHPRRAGRLPGHFFLNDNRLYPVAPGRFEALSGGCQLFPTPPPLRRETGLQPPHPARSMPWHRRRRTTRAPASCSADAW